MICRRYAALTGVEPALEATGETFEAAAETRAIEAKCAWNWRLQNERSEYRRRRGMPTCRHSTASRRVSPVIRVGRASRMISGAMQPELSRKVKLQGSDDQILIREALIRRLRELALAGRPPRAELVQGQPDLAEAGAADVDRFDPEEEKRKVVEAFAASPRAMKDGGGDA
ncbi:MAG: hypothetical protein U1E48_12605 [Paracoccaceae bacterium]